MTYRPRIYRLNGHWFGEAPFSVLVFESYDDARYWLLHQKED